ncbi:M3 family metallopeptidase [Elongatibacter sediminis]|uniref:oligopeptidase A n=1 Tax=Elongatibacter sediminis TaxID=3119006 RepID=A0AAW9RBY4_9GAMM
MDTKTRPADPQAGLYCPVSGLPDFPAIRPGEMPERIAGLLQRHREGVERRLGAGDAASWSFFAEELEWTDAIDRAWAPLSHLSAVADSPEVREAYNECREMLTGHSTWRQQHRGIHAACLALHQSDEFQSLTAEQQRIVEIELRDFHLAGVDLDEDSRREYGDIVSRLSSLGTRFQENLMDATRAWTRHYSDAKGLAGLPDAELRLLAANASAHEQEGWLVDLSFPSYLAVMTHAEDRDLRRDVYEAYVTRASELGPHAGQWDNTPVIAETLALRHRLARLLGYDTYADYALATRMAPSPERVLEFLGDLAAQALPAAREQFDALSAFARDQGGPEALEPWDLSFWSERYRQAELQLSDEMLKPYFPLQPMLDALFHTAGRVFGISLEKDDSVPVWHSDADFYWAHDRHGKRFAGLYVDFYARKEKRGGAWMDVCRSRRVIGSHEQLPVAFLNCNFPQPSGGHPSLLTHNDLQTLFHEFGHCLHHMLTRVDWPQINGIANVEWDAVELPSQLMENWCWEEDLLDGFSRHYESGEPLPPDLKQRLLRSHHFQKAMMLMRQLEFALGDFRMHLEYDPENPRDPLDLWAEVRARCTPVPVPEWNRFLNGFSHVFGGGYSAGYYSYLWAELLAADAWDRFAEEGTFSETVGEALCREILSVGGSRPAMESFAGFRGREPVPEPLLRSYGLA